MNCATNKRCMHMLCLENGFMNVFEKSHSTPWRDNMTISAPSTTANCAISILARNMIPQAPDMPLISSSYSHAVCNIPPCWGVWWFKTFPVVVGSPR